ncbi:MAG: chemotaxis protein CheD [Anaerolineae bacterium]|jgi:chemotaxis protein CheD|nr:MAG: chemotaxis protein CheD [Anaerolineae bacterium]
MQDNLAVGLGEYKISHTVSDVLVAYGLGSCVGIGLYDPQLRLAGLLHAVLPSSPNGAVEKSAKYVTSGIELLLEEMIKAGAVPSRIIVRMAGGANMLTAPGFAHTFNIGTRNVEAAHETLQRLRLRLVAEEVGGTIGRTVRFYVRDGRMTIRTVGNQEREV